ncbi:MAG TPA: hypothetical protein VFX33_00590 [Actinomycetales bacterium]|nr:hypothetical protein [Actinomycetales bacterium]
MKRALLPVVAAVLALAACGNDSGNGSSASGSSSEASSSTTTSSSTASAGGSTAAESNKQAREACEKAVVGKAAGATFPEPGNLRVASSAEGKQYTVSGTAQVSGAAKDYTCSVIVTPDKAEVADVTVG